MRIVDMFSFLLFLLGLCKKSPVPLWYLEIKLKRQKFTPKTPEWAKWTPLEPCWHETGREKRGAISFRIRGDLILRNDGTAVILSRVSSARTLELCALHTGQGVPSGEEARLRDLAKDIFSRELSEVTISPNLTAAGIFRFVREENMFSAYVNGIACEYRQARQYGQ